MEEGGASESIGADVTLASRLPDRPSGYPARRRTQVLPLCLLLLPMPLARAQPAPEVPGAESILAAAAALIDGAQTAYVSDYLSFEGGDETGRVLFALDTNRGRSGEETYQAEHFVAMYAEHEGWVDLAGYDDFPNEAGALLDFPDSPWFQLTGAPLALESVASPRNEIGIALGALTPRIATGSQTTQFALASGPATMSWRGRQLTGRVIYEFLAMRDSNRLASQGLGGALRMVTEAPDFQGLYLASGDDDFYAHLALSSAASDIGEPLMAFWARAGHGVSIRNLSFEVTGFAPALGFYRWPSAWELGWQSDCGDARLSIESVAHATQTNWVIGGFGMRAVVGRFECGAETAEYFGFAELIR